MLFLLFCLKKEAAAVFSFSRLHIFHPPPESERDHSIQANTHTYTRAHRAPPSLLSPPNMTVDPGGGAHPTPLLALANRRPLLGPPAALPGGRAALTIPGEGVSLYDVEGQVRRNAENSCAQA